MARSRTSATYGAWGRVRIGGTRISRRPGSSCAESTIRAAVWDGSAAVLGRFDGAAAIRRLLEDWIDAYEEQHFKQWDGRELGDGVVFVVAPLA